MVPNKCNPFVIPQHRRHRLRVPELLQHERRTAPRGSRGGTVSPNMSVAKVSPPDTRTGPWRERPIGARVPERLAALLFITLRARIEMSEGARLPGSLAGNIWPRESTAAAKGISLVYGALTGSLADRLTGTV